MWRGFPLLVKHVVGLLFLIPDGSETVDDNRSWLLLV